jgi:hypothetical protein
MPLKHSKIFQHALTKYCKDSLAINIIAALANILSMDYHLRGERQNIDQYPEICAQKVSKYLESAQFENNSIDDVLTLFAIAISQNSSDKDAQSQETYIALAKDKAILEEIFASLHLLGDLSSEEKKIAINELLKLKKIDKQIDFQIFAQHQHILLQHVSYTLSKDHAKKAELIQEILKFSKNIKKFEKPAPARSIK